MTISSGVRPLTHMACLWLRRQVRFGAVVLGNALKWGFLYTELWFGEALYCLRLVAIFAGRALIEAGLTWQIIS
ncbi:MAG: hypothetical protein Fur0025_16700 [Oscillatoriaceae cyanobacterium]